MSKLFMIDFECPNDHAFEELVQPTVNTIKCPYCSKKARRIVSGTSINWDKMGIDTDFPTCADRWEKSRRIRAKSDNRDNLKMY